MITVTDDKLYYDGYMVGTLKDDIPPSIRDQVEKFLEIGNPFFEQCAQCGALVVEEA